MRAAGERSEGEASVRIERFPNVDVSILPPNPAPPDFWQDRAACFGVDPDIFFPIGSTGPALEQIETARRICTACEVNDECLEFALATNQEAGVWGGTTEEERRKLRKAWLAKQRAAS